MPANSQVINRIQHNLKQHSNAIVALVVCLFLLAMAYVMQIVAIRGALPPIDTSGPQEYQMAKLVAEIQQIRSDTTGSLFWLKMIALFVTVGGAVSGYIIGQSRTTQKKLDFEKKKNIDTAYQSIVQKLADKDPRLRAAAAVELGTILQSFPTEWCGDDSSDEDQKRKSQLIQLTKQVLAASLAIEDNEKVLKTLTIALASHKRWIAPDIVERASNVFVATIPFAFYCGDKTLPSGDYTILISATDDALVIKGGDSNTATIRFVTASEAPAELKIAKLIFHRYGENNFLSEIRGPNGQERRQLPQSERERKLAARIQEASANNVSPPDTLEVVEIVDTNGYSDVRELDLSGAKAADAFWARADFTYSDFYKAKLAGASFRRSVLAGAALRQAELPGAVLVQANCYGAKFMMADLSKADLGKADLRNADLTNATLVEANFEAAKVFGCKLAGAKFAENPEVLVDNSENGDGSNNITLTDWLALHQPAGNSR